MKKKSGSRLPWLLGLVVLLLAAVLPLTAFADGSSEAGAYTSSADTEAAIMPLAEGISPQEAMINVTFTFDASVVAEDIGQLYEDMQNAGLLADETNLPGDITVSVPAGSTVQAALQAAKAQAPFSEVGMDNGYVTQIGFVGSDGLSTLVNIPIGNYSSGNVFYCAGWSYEINDVPGASGMASDTISEDNTIVSFHYNLCTEWSIAEGAMVNYDQKLLNAYNDLIAAADLSKYDTTDFSAAKLEALEQAISDAEDLYWEVYGYAVASGEALGKLDNSVGVWIGLYESVYTPGGAAMTGVQNLIDRLQAAKVAIDKAAAVSPANILETLYVGNLMATDPEENLIAEFAADSFEYVVLDYPTKSDSLPTMFKYLYAPASTKANVTVALNGTDITPATVPSSYITVRTLVWDNGQYLNTLTFTVTPPENSGLEAQTYTVKLYRELEPAEMLQMVQAESLLTWETIRGLNTAQSAVTSPLTLPVKLELPDGLGEVNVSWASSNEAVVAADGAVTRPAQDTAVTLTATITAGADGTAVTENQTFEVTVTAKSSKEEKLEQMNTLLENISAGYTSYSGSNDDWKLMDLAAYAKLNPATANKITAEARQAYLNTVIAAVAKDDVGESALAKATIILQSIGADPANLYPVNSNTPISAAGKLGALESHDPVSYVGSYTLLAFNQGDYQTAAAEEALVAAILANQREDGAWEEWGACNNSTASMLIALSFYADDAAVQAAIDKGLAYLSSQQQEDGTWRYDASYGSNATSGAAIIKALAALGIDPDTDPRFVKAGGSALDGLLKFALADNSGFGYTDNTVADPYTTPEAFQALVAAVQVMTTGQPYNVYDFSDNQVAPARATGSSEGSGGSVKPDPGAGNVKVTFTIKADTGYWLRTKSVTVQQGTSVMDAFLKAIEGTGITQEGAENGYVSSITKDGRTLGEFDGGPNSGWQYKVDGELPTIGMDEYALEGGEDVVLYFTEDWTTDPASSGFGGGGSSASAGSVVLTPSAVVNGDKATTAVTTNDVEKVITQAQKENTDTIIIEPEVSGKAAEIIVSLPTEAAQKVADEKLNVTLNTPNGNLTLPNLALAAVAQQASGVDIRLSVISRDKASADSAAEQALAAAGGSVASVSEVKLISDNKEITSFGGHEITVDLPVSGEAFKTQQEYKVVVVSANGQVETVVGRCLRVGGQMVVRVQINHLSTFIVTTAAVGEVKPTFADVPVTSWFYEAVQFVQEAGLMQGEAEGQFNPNGYLNRAMLVTILYRLEQEPAASASAPFSDVAEGSWYAKAVAWASAKGIVNGYEDGSFQPAKNISREELAAVLYRYEQQKGGGFTGAWAFKLDYADAAQVAEWAHEAVCWTTMNGIIQGDEAKNLNPQGNATRAEAAVMLMRFCELQAK